MSTPLLVGTLVGVAIAILARIAGFERRTFFAATTLVVAHYYLLFAVMAGDMGALASEGAIAFTFAALALIGFRWSLELVAVALALHGVQDAWHGALVLNTGTPDWWPSFCMAFDVTAAAALAWQIRGACRLATRCGGQPRLAYFK